MTRGLARGRLCTCGAICLPSRTIPAPISRTNWIVAIPVRTSVAVRQGRTSSVGARGVHGGRSFVPPGRPPSRLSLSGAGSVRRDRGDRRVGEGNPGLVARRGRAPCGQVGRLVQLPALRRQPLQRRGRGLPERRRSARSTRCTPSSRRSSTPCDRFHARPALVRALARTTSRLRPVRRVELSPTRARSSRVRREALLEWLEGGVRRVRAAAAGARRAARRAAGARAPARRAQGAHGVHDARSRHPRGGRGARGASREIYLELAARRLAGGRAAKTATSATSMRSRPTSGAMEPLLRDVRCADRAARGEAPAPAALAEGPAHAYLFHGPPGVGKRDRARLRAELLGDARPGGAPSASRPLRARAARRPDPDRRRSASSGATCTCARSRPTRRVYLIFAADTLNDEAADALLKDLEEPPPYAVIVLVADELGPLPETIRSRCQLVPFRRLSERAVRAESAAQAPGLPRSR